MIRTLLADAVLIAHLGFILFAILGGLLVLRWPRLIWLHLAALAWAFAVEVAGLTCPLTPLEWRLRGWDDSGETSGFIARYLTPLIYPPGLTQAHQWLLAAALMLVNVAIYAGVWRARRRASPVTGQKAVPGSVTVKPADQPARPDCTRRSGRPDRTGRRRAGVGFRPGRRSR